MSNAARDKLRIHVNIQITATTLQDIVTYAKQSARKSDTGAYRVDTADQVSDMITRFLEEMDFEGYVKNITASKPLS